jgi:putative transposase
MTTTVRRWLSKIDTSLRAARLIRVFVRLKETRGVPNMLRVDNGPALLSQVFLVWMWGHSTLIPCIEPGKLNQNAFIERFNCTYREEVLSMYLFATFEEVREITSQWLQAYNEVRPHDALSDIPLSVYTTGIAGNSTLELSSWPGS